MFRNATSFGGMLLLAGAALIATPGLSWAQRGGHGGGGHFGGAHFGGAHFGGFHTGMYHGGYHYGYPHAYYNHPYYGGYAYPYYGGYAYPYTGSGVTYDSGYYGSYPYVTPSYPDVSASVTSPSVGYQAYSPPAATQPDTTAHVTVSAPAGARLWFDNTATTSTGPLREFASPPLTPGKKYTYDVKATWSENGHEVTQTQKVEVTPGAHIDVHFPLPSKSAGQGSEVTRR